MAVKEQKLTPWFPAGTAPARSGYYDTRVQALGRGPLIEIRLYWNAERKAFYASPNSCPLFGHFGFDQWREWRGLAEQPK